MKLNYFIKPSKNFQYSVNLSLDINSKEKIKEYLPTPSGLDIIEDVLLSTIEGDKLDRAHILVGAYGKGKSHLVLSILSLLSDKDRKLAKNILNKSKEIKPQLYDLLCRYFDDNTKLLPIIIEGSNNNTSQLFLHSLKKSLHAAGIYDIIPNTYFDFATDRINGWQKGYKETYKNFCDAIQCTPEEFVKLLSKYDQVAYNKFVELYPALTSGSEFLPYGTGSGIVDIYSDVSLKVKEYGYSGIFVVYDEFSKFLENTARDASHSDIKMFQDFAERCNRAGKGQMHLMLITHKSIQGYTDELPREKIDAWSGVENRFTKIEISNHSSQLYEIVGQVIKKEKEFENYAKNNASKFNAIVEYIKQSRAFGDIEKESILGLVKSVYPLEPFALFLLPQISEKIAQNERTIFTFLASSQKNTLTSFLSEEQSGDFPLLTADYIFDYFEPLLRKDNYKKKTNIIWQKAVSALDALGSDDIIHSKIIKSIALIEILDQPVKLLATCELLRKMYSLICDSLTFDRAIAELKEKQIIAIKNTNEQVVLIDSNSANVHQELSDEMARIKANRQYDRMEVLNGFAKGKCLYPTRYNDLNDIVRFFDIVFISEEAISNLEDGEFLPTSKNADGRIYLIKNTSERIKKNTLDRLMKLECRTRNCVFIAVTESKNMDSLLLEYRANMNLEEKFKSMHSEDKIAIYQLQAHKEDVSNALSDYMSEYLYPERRIAHYYYGGKNQESIKRKSHLNEHLSIICYALYGQSPEVKSELVNKNFVTANGRNAINKVVTGLLANVTQKNLGLSGSGPEVSVKRNVLDAAGITNSENNKITTAIEDEKVKRVIDIIETSLKETVISGKISLKTLMERLTSIDSGIGLKRWLFPIYFAVVLHFYKKRTVLFYNEKEIEVSSKNIELLTESPSEYSIKIVAINNEKEKYLLKLEQIFSNHIVDSEKELNSFDFIAKAMQRWYYRLPKYTKEIERTYEGNGEYKALDRVTKKFKNALRAADINANEWLFDVLPELLGKEAGVALADAVKKLKERLDNTINEVISHIALDISNIMLPQKKVALIFALKEWANTITRDAKAYMLNGNSEELFRIIDIAENDEIETMKSLVKLVNGLRIEDFEHDAPTKFIENFKKLVGEINDKNIQKTSKKSGSVYKIISIDSEGNEHERKLEKVELSPKTKLFENDILTQIDEFGDSISVSEKRLILMQIIEKLK